MNPCHHVSFLIILYTLLKTSNLFPFLKSWKKLLKFCSEADKMASLFFFANVFSGFRRINAFQCRIYFGFFCLANWTLSQIRVKYYNFFSINQKIFPSTKEVFIREDSTQPRKPGTQPLGILFFYFQFFYFILLLPLKRCRKVI